MCFCFPTDRTPAEDLQTLHRQAAEGDAAAQVNLGFLYAHGHGVPQDYIQTRQWWEKAAAQGRAEAQTSLGFLYSKGHSVPQDFVMARQLFEQASAQGNAKVSARSPTPSARDTTAATTSPRLSTAEFMLTSFLKFRVRQ